MEKGDEDRRKEKTRVGNTPLNVYKSLGQPTCGGYMRLVMRGREEDPLNLNESNQNSRSSQVGILSLKKI